MEEIFSGSDAGGADTTKVKPGDDFFVVGIGASAGGIKALKEFFAHVPADSGMAYVVILHLSPQHESHLAEVLQHAAAIPVTQITDRVRVEPNHVYVIPPNRSLAMTDGHLALSEVTRIEERRAPVDIFFRTLAQARGARRLRCSFGNGRGRFDGHEAREGDGRHLPCAGAKRSRVQRYYAREGFYTPNDAADVSPEQLRQFFVKEQNGYRVRRELRELVLFANQNLIKDPPFSHLDLVTCRNLLIYLNRTAQDRAFDVFHFALNPGGFLFLGNSESLNGTNDSFLPIDKEHHIFQSRAVPPRTVLPVPEASLATMRAGLRPKKEDRAQESQAFERLSYADIHQRLLEQYAAPSVVVNEKHEVVHLTERAGRYMQISGGEPSLNLLNIVRPELRLELHTALYRAAQENTNIETRELQMRIDDRLQLVKLKVRPALRADDTTRGFLLVLFEETREATETEQAQLKETMRTVSDEPITRHLEDELVRVKAQLRFTVEQYEVQTEELKASNEELQAMNEELRSAAEELETSKEELQSINEELLTVNQELKIKIEELSQSNNDFQNLMSSTEIGTVFLDRALRVKLFTPHARSIVNLLPSDVGRPLADITNQFVDNDILKDIESVLERLQTIEREIETGDGRWFLMRAIPYRTKEDQISGVVLTFLDVTARHRQEEASRALARSLEQQTRIFNTTLTSISDFVYIFDRDGRFRFANQPLLDLLGITSEEIAGKNFFDLHYPPELAAKLHKQIQQIYDTKKALRDETPFTSPARADGFYEYIFTPVFAADGNTVEFVAGSTRDVTHRKQIELALRASEDRLHLTMESVTDYAISTMDTEGRFSSWNVGAERIFGDRLTGYAKIARDLTEQQRAEEALRRAHEELEHKVEERTHDLAKANEALRIENAERKNDFMQNDAGLSYRSANTFAGAQTAVAQEEEEEEEKSSGINRAHDFINPVAFNGLLTNKLLMALPGEAFARLLPHLEPVSLSCGEDLYGAGEDIWDVYFPETAVLSDLYILADGSTTEAAMIGKEGMTGLSAIFDSPAPTHYTQVIVTGTALRMSADVLKQEFARGESVQRLLLIYASARIAQLSQRAVCNGRHTVRERLCSWLMMIHDRVGNDQLPLTHERIAYQLGTRRAGITSAVTALRDEQIISCSRGQIRIIDRQRLEMAACECYQTLHRQSLAALQR